MNWKHCEITLSLVEEMMVEPLNTFPFLTLLCLSELHPMPPSPYHFANVSAYNLRGLFGSFLFFFLNGEAFSNQGFIFGRNNTLCNLQLLTITDPR